MNFSLFSLLTIAAFIATTQSHNPRVIRPDGGQTARRLFKQRQSANNVKEFDIRVDIEKETVINTNNERSNHLNSMFEGPSRRDKLRNAYLKLQKKRKNHKNNKNKVEPVSSNKWGTFDDSLLGRLKSRSLLDRINPEMDADVPVGPLPDEELDREHGPKHNKPRPQHPSRPEKQDPRGRPDGRPNKREPRHNHGHQRGHNIDEMRRDMEDKRIPEGKGAVPEPRPDSRQYNRYQKPKRGQHNSHSKPPKKEALKNKVDAEILKEKRRHRQKKFNKVKDTIKDTNEEEEEEEIILIDIE